MMFAERLAQALRGALVRLAGEEPPKPGSFTDAIEWHRARDRMLTKKEWRALGTAERQRAFTVANVAQLDLINDVWKAMDKAVDQGTTFEDFKKEVGDKLIKEWKGTVKNPAHRLETIFRTNVQVAYGAGRWKAAKAAVKTHPFWQLAVVRDNRTSDTCLGVAGIVLPADDDWWKTNVPPRHFNCRSTIRSLRKREAERIQAEREKAGLPNKPGGSKSQEGFGDEPPTPTVPEPTKGKPVEKPPIDKVADEKVVNSPPPLADEANSKGIGKPPRAQIEGELDDNNPPPWVVDNASKPPGTIDESEATLPPLGKRLADHLASNGNNIKVKPLRKGARRPLVTLNPERADVTDHDAELTSISKSTAGKKALLRKLQSAPASAKARNLVIDARDIPLVDEDVVRDAVAEAIRRRWITHAMLAYVLVTLNDVDLTFPVPSDS